MPQKSLTTNLSTPETLQFHQIQKHQSSQSKSSSLNQRVLILSTPIKLTDGTINMEQRTIPLRIDNNQLTLTATESKNKIVSLKRNIEPPPLALPLNQLNQKSPTFVKNEIGQVMGKLIPLGKFSNITRNTLAPISTASSSPTTTSTASKNLKSNVSKPSSSKLFKFDEKIEEVNDTADEKLKGTLKSKEKTNASFTTEMRPKNPSIASTTIVPKVENAQEQLITITDAKPKKQVHLVLKGYENMASIGQTGTKIKLIPLDQWKVDAKSNFLKNQTNSSLVTQPKIVDVRTCTVDEMNESDNANLDENKLNINYSKEDFDIDDLLEKDPLDIGGMTGEEVKSVTYSTERSLSKNNISLNKELGLVQSPHTSQKVNLIRASLESEKLNSSKIITLAKGGMSVELKLDRKLKTDSLRQKKSNVMLKNAIIDSRPSEIIADNAKKVGPVVNSLIVEKIEEKPEPEFRKIDINYDNLYKRFGINKSNVTKTEIEMLSYICSLKKKLSRCQKSKVQPLPALEPREYLGIYNLSNIQKRFIESQLRNSGRMLRKQRFIKTDIAMARDVLRATGPRAYSNLKKLFSLPDINAVVKTFSKT